MNRFLSFNLRLFIYLHIYVRSSAALSPNLSLYPSSISYFPVNSHLLNLTVFHVMLQKTFSKIILQDIY